MVKKCLVIIISIMLSIGTVYADFDMKFINMIKVMAEAGTVSVKHSSRSKYYVDIDVWNKLEYKEKKVFVAMFVYYNMYIGNDCLATIYNMSTNRVIAHGNDKDIHIY